MAKMGVMRRVSQAAALLLVLVLLMVAPRGHCQRGRHISVTQEVGATQRLRHVFGVQPEQHNTSPAPQPPADKREKQENTQQGDSGAVQDVQQSKNRKEEENPDGALPETHPDPESRQNPHQASRPEPPRVPELPEHLPPGLASRLSEFPSVAASPDGSPPHAFFQPRIQVEAEEVSDAEWEQLLTEGWARDGVVPALLPAPPPYLVNVNFGEHQCVHLGNAITPAHAHAAPNTLRFPGEEGRRYTVMLLDMDAPSPPRLQWLLINAPARQPRQGTEAVEYEAPRPGLDTGQHRLVFLVYLQRTALRSADARVPRARACQSGGRDNVALSRLVSDLELEGPTAANYFLSEWDVTVEHTCTTPAPS